MKGNEIENALSPNKNSIRQLKKSFSKTIKFGGQQITSISKTLGVVKKDSLLPTCQHGYQFQTKSQLVENLIQTENQSMQQTMNESFESTPVGEEVKEDDLLKLEQDVENLKNEMMSLSETLSVLRSQATNTPNDSSLEIGPTSNAINEGNINNNINNEFNDINFGNRDFIFVQENEKDNEEEKVNIQFNQNLEKQQQVEDNYNNIVTTPVNSNTIRRGKTYPIKLHNRESASQPRSLSSLNTSSSSSSSSSSRYSQSQPRQSDNMRRHSDRVSRRPSNQQQPISRLSAAALAGHSHSYGSLNISTSTGRRLNSSSCQNLRTSPMSSSSNNMKAHHSNRSGYKETSNNAARAGSRNKMSIRQSSSSPSSSSSSSSSTSTSSSTLNHERNSNSQSRSVNNTMTLPKRRSSGSSTSSLSKKSVSSSKGKSSNQGPPERRNEERRYSSNRNKNRNINDGHYSDEYDETY